MQPELATRRNRSKRVTTGKPFANREAREGGRSRAYRFLSPVAAKFFRVVFKRTAASASCLLGRATWISLPWGLRLAAPPTDYEIAELVLHPGARVTGLKRRPLSHLCPISTSSRPLQSLLPTLLQSPRSSISPRKLHPDGTLDWTPPPGHWVILRFGYSLLGITNHPATTEATGLEVDKLNRTYVKNYMNGYLDSYKRLWAPIGWASAASGMWSPIAGKPARKIGRTT